MCFAAQYAFVIGQSAYVMKLTVVSERYQNNTDIRRSICPVTQKQNNNHQHIEYTRGSLFINYQTTHT